MAKKVRHHGDSGDPKRRKPARRPRMSGKKRAATKPPVPPSPAQIVQRVRALNVLAWAHGTMELLLQDFPESRSTFQPSPTDHHLLWTLGHLADTYYVYANMLDGKRREPPFDYVKLFGFGSKPVDDPAIYPSLAHVRAEYDRAYELLVGVVSQQTDLDLAKPLHGDNAWLADTRLEAVFKMAHHEGWHQGQVSAIRRALGLKSIY
ncbi:MAG: DinB family protein [Phycisphaerales bacterium]|nr:DinB family protein [Phycisphaerales bacterium]